mmetsp:Transcript_16138/g.56296  ORF Transcript_16138/g.56296 Transcript_16138/m.56296 type:complete len:208 (-) Transcript_16138:4975-5598(-)
MQLRLGDHREGGADVEVGPLRLRALRRRLLLAGRRLPQGRRHDLVRRRRLPALCPGRERHCALRRCGHHRAHAPRGSGNSRRARLRDSPRGLHEQRWCAQSRLLRAFYGGAGRGDSGRLGRCWIGGCRCRLHRGPRHWHQDGRSVGGARSDEGLGSRQQGGRIGLGEGQPRASEHRGRRPGLHEGRAHALPPAQGPIAPCQTPEPAH